MIFDILVYLFISVVCAYNLYRVGEVTLLSEDFKLGLSLWFSVFCGLTIGIVGLIYSIMFELFAF